MTLPRRAFLSSGIALAAEPSQADDWQGVKKIVAVGDVHADKDAFAAVLKMSGLIDDQEQWIGGAAHLVQIGDIPARGPQARSCFDFIMRLEQEAAKAGGRVHALIGNHDAGVIHGDLRGTFPEEFGDFRDEGSLRSLDKAWAAEMESLRKIGRLPSDPRDLDKAKEHWFEARPPGFMEHRVAFGPAGPYGSWIRRNNTVIRINDSLFVHGGISPKYASRTRGFFNTTIRKELADPANLIPGLATEIQGPLWYRGFAEEDGPKIEAHLQAVLRFHGVKRIVVGHTVTRSAILPRFGGCVLNIDLGLSRFYGRPPACLLLEDGAATVLHRQARIPVPGASKPSLLAYLNAVLAADEQPSPVSKLITETMSRP